MSTIRRPTTHSTLHVLDARKQRRKRKQVSLVSRSNRILFFSGTVFLVLLSGIILAAGVCLISAARSLPAVENMAQIMEPEPGKVLPPTQFYDRSGKILLYTLENPGIERRYLSIDPADSPHFSPQLVQVMTALEGNYWSDSGISLQKITDPEPHTIAEHLVIDSLLYEEPAGLPRAIRMRLLAVQIQIRYGKAKILEWYLNTACFGHLAFGADQASQVYLGKPATQLNLTESALLVSLLTTPTLNPLEAPQAARIRTDAVLDQLAATGQYASSDIGNAKTTQLMFLEPPQETAEVTEFIQYSIDQLEKSISSTQIERGGLKVITTLDADLQRQLICTLATQLLWMATPSDAGEAVLSSECEAAALLPLPDNSVLNSANAIPAVSGNSLVINPVNSEILAWSGVLSTEGIDAQPEYEAGSLLSPFVAAAAFAHGMSPATLVWDVPEAEDAANLNPDGIWHGPQSLRQVIAKDYFNAVYQTAELVGFDDVRTLADTLGLNSLDQVTFEDDLANGEGKTDLLEMGQAFSTFATLGQQTGIPNDTGNTLSPVAVLQVEDLAGNVVYGQEGIVTRPVMDPGLAYLVNDVLSEVTYDTNLVSRTTRQKINPDVGRPAAAAVETAAGGTQAWTVGYTPHHLVVVWMGIPDNKVDGSSRTLQKTFPAGVWQAVIRYAAQNESSLGWEKPANVIQVKVCSPSGQLPTDACSDIVDELFLSGNEPVAYDTLYQTYSINRETGKLATVFTPLELVEQRTFFVIPEEYKGWALTGGIPQPPTQYDPIPSQESIAGVEITFPSSLAYIHGLTEIIGSAEGNNFTSYRLDVGQGLYPQSWIQIGTESKEPVKNNTLGSWDTTGLNGLYVIRLTVQRSQNRLETTYTPLVVDNTPPEIVITWPQENQVIQYVEGKQVTFLADGSDTVGVDHITWYVDGIAAGERSLAPFFLSWPPTPGRHVLRVEAYDLAGNVSQSQDVEVIVQ